MNHPDGLVQQLLDTVRQRMETKVLALLREPSHAGRGVAALLDEVAAEESADLAARAEQARADGEEVQAEMYRLMQSDLLPLAVDSLRSRLRPA